MSNTPNWNPWEAHQCRDCGVKEGELHTLGCSQEICPFCKGQLNSCDCVYKHFYPSYDEEKRFSGLPREVYENGLPEKQAAEWDRLLDEKGPVPFVWLPWVCARCGVLWPDLFMEDDWDETMPANVQDQILCRKCYEFIKALVTDGSPESEKLTITTKNRKKLEQKAKP